MDVIIGSIGLLLVVTVATALMIGLDRWSLPRAGGGASDLSSASAASSPYASPELDPEAESFEPLPRDGVASGFVLTGVWDHAVAAVGRSQGPMFVGGALMTLLDACNGNGGGNGSSSDSGGESSLLDALRGGSALAQSELDFDGMDLGVVIAIAVVAIVIVVFCFGVVMGLRAWLNTGWIRLQREAIVEGTGSFGTLFGGLDRFWPMFGWRVLRGVLVFVPASAVGFFAMVALFATDTTPSPAAMVLLALMVIVVLVQIVWLSLALSLGDYFVALEEDGPFMALRRSMDATRGHRLTLLGYSIVWGLIIALFSLAGCLVLCVGALITFPIGRALYDTAWCRGYLIARDGVGATSNWAR